MASKNSTTVEDLQQLVRSFAEARDWGQFHTPRNLVLALAGEVGELAALIQWTPDDDTESWLKDDSNRLALEAEMADVFAYLLRLADVAGVDLAAALRAKTQLNNTRYPQDRAKGSADKYTKYE
jgi:NTP pyrophosphatase (non-canonical NTP hydrolase)